MGTLTIAWRDAEQMGQVRLLQHGLLDLGAPTGVQRGLSRRHHFADALTWLEIHGEHPDAVEHWRFVSREAMEIPHGSEPRQADQPSPRRRRRRRRRPWRGPGPAAPAEG